MILQKDKIYIYFDWAVLSCLCLLIFCLPFLKAGVEIFVWLAFFLWLLKKILGYQSGTWRQIVLKTELNKALGVFIAINLLSVIFSVNRSLSLRGFFGKELKFMAIYFMLVELINTKARLKCILMAIISSAVLLTVDAAGQYFWGIDFLLRHSSARLGASFGNSNGFAGWLIVMIPLFSGLLAIGQPKTSSYRLKDVVCWYTAKSLLFLLIILLSICLLMTYSRGAWLGIVLGFFLMACFAIKNYPLKIKMLSLFGIVCLLAVFLFLPPSIKTKIKAIGRVNFKSPVTAYGRVTVNERIKSATKTRDGSATIRINLWKESLRIIGDYPLVGCGLNTYASVAPKYKISESGGIYPHNSYLQMAAETGLLGLFAFLGVLFVFFKTGFRYLGQKKNPLVFGLLAGILAFLVHGFFDVHLYALQLVVLFWFMLGLTVAVIKLRSGI